MVHEAARACEGVRRKRLVPQANPRPPLHLENNLQGADRVDRQTARAQRSVGLDFSFELGCLAPQDVQDEGFDGFAGHGDFMETVGGNS
jgi:hypothetical protein